jgi:hypothetical protein
MVHIWLIAGYAGSGKTTAAGILEKILPNSATTAFAKRVKDEVAATHAIPRTLLETQEGKAMQITPTKTARDLLIEYAAAKKEETQNPAIWAEYVKEEILQNPTVANWILHDWRYVEEYDCLTTVPGSTLHTIRIQTNKPSSSSPSEHELDNTHIQTIVWNTGSLEEFAYTLRKEVLRPYDTIKNGHKVPIFNVHGSNISNV